MSNTPNICSNYPKLVASHKIESSFKCKTCKSWFHDCDNSRPTRQETEIKMCKKCVNTLLPFSSIAFSYPEPILRAVNGARQGALAKSISNWHLIGHNVGCCSNTGYILLPCFYGIRLWIWPEPLVAPRVRRALGTRMVLLIIQPRSQGICSWEAKTLVDAGHVTHRKLIARGGWTAGRKASWALSA
jgi:hypothetical protein